MTKQISLQPRDKENNPTSTSASVPLPKDMSKVNVQKTNQYSLRSKDRQPIPSSSKNSGKATKPNKNKQISRRKLPNEPDKRPRSISDAEIQKRLSSFNSPKKEKLFSRNSENSIRETQESKLRIQHKDANENDISNTKPEKSNDIRKDRPFTINKVKSKSIASLNDSTSESKEKKSTNLVSKSNNKIASTSKSKSEMDISGKVRTNYTSSNTHAKQKSSSVLDRKQPSSSETNLSTNQKDVRSRNIAGNSKKPSEGDKKVILKSQSLDAANEFKKPDVPKLRRRPESSRTGKPRESVGEGNISTSSTTNTSLKNRPPTGVERSRSARARRREEIASKLASLETSYESLEKSPNRTLTKKTSMSSADSNTSSITKKTSLVEAVNKQQRSSLRNKNSFSRTSSATSRSSVNSEGEAHDISKTRRSMSNDTSMQSRSRSAAKRTPSNASLERKKIDGLLSKEEQDLMRRRSKSASEKPGTKATRDNLERIRLLRSKAMDIPQIRRTDSVGSESTRRSNSFKAKHRRLATRTSNKNHDDKKVPSCNLEQNCKNPEETKEPSCNLEQNFKSANDSFDDITVVEKKDLESAVDGAPCDVKRSTPDKERNENSPFSLRRKQKVDGESNGTDSQSDFISDTADHQELLTKDSRPPNDEQNNEEIPDEKLSENRKIHEESDCTSARKEDLKMEFRLHNTGSWMVLDYEGLGESPKTVKKIISSEDHQEEHSPRASMSSVETSKEDKRINDDFVLKMQVSASEDESEIALNHNKENGKASFGEEDGLETSVINGALLTEKVSTDSSFIHILTNENKEKTTQNGSVKPHANGRAASTANGEMPGNDPVRKGAFKKKPKGLNQKSKTSRMKSQSVENLASGKNRVTFEEIQNLDRSPKDTKKKVNFPFALKKKKISGSCSDLDGTDPDINVLTSSPTKTIKTTSHGLVKSPEDKSFSSSPEKSHEKKKLAPFKMFKKRKSQETSS